MRNRCFILSPLLALVSIGIAQAADLRIDPRGHCGEYEMRPVRKLTSSEAKAWIAKLRSNPKKSDRQQSVPEAKLIRFSTAGEKDLFNWSRDKDDKYHRLIKAEILVRAGAVLGPHKPQPAAKDSVPFVLGHWEARDYQERPQRRLTETEAASWIKNVERRSRNYNTAQNISRATLIKITTSTSKELAGWITGRRFEDISEFNGRLAAYSEIAVRRDKSPLPILHRNALTDDTYAYRVIRHLDPSKKTLVSLYTNLYPGSHTKDMAALDLLKQGDTRGAGMVREAMEQERTFVRATGAGTLWSDEACYLLIQHVDGNNRKLIEKDLRMAWTEIRYRYPDLAKLKRPAIDIALLNVAKSEDHVDRKWLAVAARQRPQSAAYRKALVELAKDPVADVARTALWALGKSPMPENLIHLIKN